MYTLQRPDGRFWAWHEYGASWEFDLSRWCIHPPSFLYLLRLLRGHYGGEIRKVA